MRTTAQLATGLLILTQIVAVPLRGQAQDTWNPGDRVQPYGENPWYWQYEGKPALLIGGTDQDNPFQWEESRLPEQLDLLVAGVRPTSARERPRSACFCSISSLAWPVERWPKRSPGES